MKIQNLFSGRSVLIIFIIFSNTESGFSGDLQTGTQVRQVFIELLDATEPRLPTWEKKQKIIDTILNRRDILKELFFKKNREIWDDANFRIDYDKVKDQLKLGPFTSLLYYRKEENDWNQALSNFNQLTFNVVPNLAKTIIKHVPLPPHPLGVGVINFPGIREATDHEVEVLAAGINQFIVNFRLNDSQLIKELLTPPQGFDLQLLPEGFRDQFMDALQEFINNFPLERKRLMARALLELPPDASIGKIVAATSIHSGSLFVKLLQWIQSYGPPDMQNELKILLDSLPPHLNESEIRKMMEDNIPPEVWGRIIYFDYHPLSVASLSQVHRMILKLPSGDIVEAVVKFLAPKFIEMAAQDLANLESVMSGFKFGRKLVLSLKTIMGEELDLETEAEYTAAGAILYRDPNKGIDVVDILKGDAFPLTKNMEAQTFAKGIPLSKINQQTILASGVSETEFNVYLARALIGFMKKWFKNTIFESHHLGHADPHRGNLFFNIEKGNLPPRKPYRLTPIDFGSMCRMTQKEAQAMVLVSQGLFLSQTSDIMQGLYQLSLIANDGEEDPAEIEKLRKLQEFVEGSRKEYESMQVWFTKITTEALKLQIDFPTSFIQFNRGRVYIENVIDETLNRLKQSDDPEAQKQYRKLMGSFEVYMSSSVSSMVKDLGLKVSSLGLGNSDSVISIPSIAWGSFKKCSSILSSCFQEGPKASMNNEIYPLVKNIYDVSSAVRKDLLSDEPTHVKFEPKFKKEEK